MAAQEVRRLGLALAQELVPVNPAQAMLQALALAHMDMMLYAQLVAELDAAVDTAVHTRGSVEGDSVHTEGAVHTTPRIYSETYHLTGASTGEAKRHVLVQLYEDAQKRCADIAAGCLRAKVAEEQVKIAQQMASAYADGMRAFALALGHSPADPKVREAMRSSLQLAAGGSTAG